jgi:hypothetical protein
MNRASLLFAGAAALALSLGACGKVGTLDQPGPLYGTQAKAKWRAQQKAAAAAETSAKHKDQDEPDPLPPDRIQDPYTLPGPTRSHPIQGAPTGPNGPPQQGVLPDPMSTPQ